MNAANIKKGTVRYDMRPTDLVQILTDVAAQLQPLAREKKLDFVVSHGNVPAVKCDPVQVREVMKNFIDNAINFTKKGRIEIRLEKRESTVRFSVKDNGKGLSNEDKAVLFTEGGRGKDSLDYNINSTGYGLFIAKGIIDAHKGRVWAESEGPGLGSTFIFELPITKNTVV